MVINRLPVNTPSHMRQIIGLESAAVCTRNAELCHTRPMRGPIIKVCEDIAVTGAL